MAEEDLDALLRYMDAIAKAVNAFTSEAVQHEAFSALIAAFEGKRHDVGARPQIDDAVSPFAVGLHGA